ncbi:CoA-binding protein [Dioszegia hungarica]|uniref:CoA-binding protein n=1 Tax=Dioszegia hungarica TaxID=4972 RepID=A0AA38H897_9TREE|nr:CoA-binding protein [Dioszegia hungarica]KAI9634624.1 CoA-binding protein [Dioszegia hungarica]
MSFTPAMRHFMHAKEYAVVGKILTDTERFDYKVLKWYQTRNFPVTPIKATATESEQIEGLTAISDPHKLSDLSNTSISIIIHPAKGLPLLKSLYPAGKPVEQGPWGIWFQPGAADGAIEKYVQENGLEGRVVLGGPCILVSGDGVRAEEGVDGKSKSAL